MEERAPFSEEPTPAPVGDPEDCYPDHPAAEKTICDDVSQLNPTEIEALFMPWNLDDIVEVLRSAKQRGRRVSMRGAKHTMGGHTLTQGGFVIDMQNIKHVRYDQGAELVTVGAGAYWSDVIIYLNQFGKSPRTLQSYCSFSVGGSLSVNAHGITTDKCMAESVVEFTMVTAGLEVIKCTPDNEHAELFRHALGGFGLFGVIYEVVLRVSDNLNVSMDALTLQLDSFPTYYESVLRAKDVEIKIARIDTTTFEHANLFVFRRASDFPSASNLGTRPIELSPMNRLLYKWLAGPMRELRFSIERAFGVALDWSSVSDRNQLLFESAAPLARLYSPLLRVDDTFILQEYFIPRKAFSPFVAGLKEVVLGSINKETCLTLLNITIRFVDQDTHTALPYARFQDGAYAFVLYFRMHRTEECDRLLGAYHSQLASLALSKGGTFYLPYRHHYSQEQLEEAYPSFPAFCKKKGELDPDNLFGNLWWDHYGARYASRATQEAEKHSVPPPALPLRPEEAPPLDLSPPHGLRREGSFQALLSNPQAKRRFQDDFLTEIFNVMSNKVLARLMSTAAWSGLNTSDSDIYRSLQESVKLQQTTLMAPFSLWAQIRQLSAQKRELTRETVSIIARLGRIGTIHDYCSIGDHGKLVLSLKKALGMRGKMWVVNDQRATDDDAAAILERGALKAEEVAEFVHTDFSLSSSSFRGIPSESVDLVTMNQGLHHLEPEQLPTFLKAVHRTLRRGGLFIIREHDASAELLPMLDCAHMVFNAVTGVPLDKEKLENRGFRSVLQWRKLVEAHGFRDVQVYEIQPHDPTEDVMMCFIKGSHRFEPFEAGPKGLTPAVQGDQRQEILGMIAQVPKMTMELGMSLVNNLLRNLPLLRGFIQRIFSGLFQQYPMLKGVVVAALDQYIDPMLTMLERFQPMADTARPVIGSGGFIPDELFLLIPVLRLRANKGGIAESLIVYVMDKVEEMVRSTANGPQAPPIPKTGKGLTMEEVRRELELLSEAMPDFRDHRDKVVDGLGLPPRATAILRGMVTGPGAGVTRYIVEKLDEESWAKLKGALKEIRQARVLPTLDAIVTQGDPYNKAMLAMLGAPSVQFTWAQTMGLKAAGMEPIVSLWRQAQEERRRVRAPSLGVPDVRLPCPVKECTLHVHRIAGLEDIVNVFMVESAVFCVRSLTRVFSDRQEDLTEEVARTLDPTTGVLRLSQLELPSSKLAGQRVLELRYRELPSPGEARRSHEAASLLDALAGAKLLDRSWRSSNGLFTWYKLPEWMQVEIVQLFGSSMEHTPWYRFPFSGILKTYFDVLFQEVSVVGSDMGWGSAIFSSAFLTDLIPGVVMSLLMAQMMVLANPCKQIAGEDYDTSKMVEQLVVLAPPRTDWKLILGGMNVQDAEVARGVWIVTVPTFKGLTEALRSMALVPTLSLASISNNAVVQVRIELSNGDKIPELLEELGSLPGCKVNFHFEFPKIGERSQPRQVSLRVEVPHLLPLIRTCNSSAKFRLVQVYDFFG